MQTGICDAGGPVLVLVLYSYIGTGYTCPHIVPPVGKMQSYR